MAPKRPSRAGGPTRGRRTTTTTDAGQGAEASSEGTEPAVQGNFAADLVGLLMPIGQLRPAPNNARRHAADKDVPVLMSSLSRYGQRKPVVAKREYRGLANVVIAGNGTMQAAETLDWTHLAVSWFDGTDDEADEYALVDNRSAELSEWDFQALAGQLQALRDRDAVLPNRIGWDEAALGPLLAAEWSPPDVGELPGGEHEQGAPMKFTKGQRATVDRGIERIRDRENDADIPDGRAVELIVADWLS